MMMGRLATLSEVEPINDQVDHQTSSSSSSSSSSSKKVLHAWRNWSCIKSHFNKKHPDLKLLLSVLACPLFPVPPHPSLPSLNHAQVSSSAEYIIQHFTAATGCRKLEGTVKTVFATGKVAMGVVDEVGATAGVSEKGCFVIWQMIPHKWQIELVVAGHKVVAGSDGTVAWRHTPWLGPHAAKGGVRPLRRAVQGLDPLAVSAVFSGAQYMGEKEIMATDCFVLKLSANQKDLVDRSDNTAEMIKHVTFGYFSQKNGLLVYLEDSFLTRIQSPGTHPTYWETTMSTTIEDYRMVDGVMIAHGGRSTVIITRFGDNLRAGPAVTRMEESWTIDDVAFNVPGLSMDCFLPPKELQKDDDYPQENLDWRSPLNT
ncbi:uncharacterized protein LOC107492608 isoform X1 [Arachis duranensis]|uniref:Uncharacterized protein LOC107492608 isoform X1 n=1 Tax=Arachis duranensis TaxID=130453 RepID=A0A6P4DTC2_ARADU|nr:uncharacterized protein LOC107492608 isoform X1 [Arachis duranensis]